ncbi:MAG: hypothetical protein KDC56_07875, partial [Flavobacteriaceae bacterium]|nr:hypothetical protein [Flavobacteriaceae bacterium]
MKYTVILFFLLSGVFINAQHTVSIKMDPANDNGWVILYKLKGSGHDYVTHTKSDDGNFTLELPANAAKGIYRIVYTTNGSPYLDFIYNDEDIALTFNPRAPNETVTFSKSEENKLFLKYLSAIGKIQYQLDSLQAAYFKAADPGTVKKMEKDYSQKYAELNKEQKGFEEQSQGMLLNHFIKASRRYYATSLFKNPADYLV